MASAIVRFEAAIINDSLETFDMESPQKIDIDVLRKNIKKLMVDLDLDRRSAILKLSHAMSARMHTTISISRISMALSGYRKGPAYEKLLGDILNYLQDQVALKAA